MPLTATVKTSSTPSDHLGTVRHTLNWSDAVDAVTDENHIQYDAFGNQVDETNPDLENRFGYTGRDIDPESDLQYNRGRYYDAAIGKWVSEDPIGFSRRLKCQSLRGQRCVGSDRSARA